MSSLRIRTSVVSLVLGTCAALIPSTASGASTTHTLPVSSEDHVGPFVEPGFASACEWHRFGEGERPSWRLMFADPLCIEYSKRDITIDNGGATQFLLAEPSRFAVASITCRYYQKDHWSVQSTSGAVPWVTWDGQYWWDKRARRGGARLTNFKVQGQAVGIGDAVLALRPRFPQLADALDDYGRTSGESGMTVDLPMDLYCAATG